MTRGTDVVLKPADPGALWAVDRLLLSALAALSGIALAFSPNPLPLLAVFAALSLFLWTSARLGPLSRASDVVHAFAPLVVIIGIFETVGFLVAVTNPMRWDATFAAADARLFGGLVPAWRNVLRRPAWLTDLLSLFYLSYYFVPTVMAVALYASDRREDFDHFVFALQVTLLWAYFGYFLFPTTGPRVPVPEAQAVLGGGTLSAGVRVALYRLELNRLDAFPSGHAALAMVFLAYGWRMLPRWRVHLALAFAGIVFSTVYLSYHYAIDLVGGFAVAAGALASMPLLRRAFGLEPGQWVAAKGSLPS